METSPLPQSLLQGQLFLRILEASISSTTFFTTGSTFPATSNNFMLRLYCGFDRADFVRAILATINDLMLSSSESFDYQKIQTLATPIPVTRNNLPFWQHETLKLSTIPILEIQIPVTVNQIRCRAWTSVSNSLQLSTISKPATSNPCNSSQIIQPVQNPRFENGPIFQNGRFDSF